MGLVDYMFLGCLIGGLPGPLTINFEGANLQLYPVNKLKCPDHIDPNRDISFLLYTRHNPIEPQALRIYDDSALLSSNFNFSEPTIFFFHAFFESYQATPANFIRTAYTRRGDHNIILLNAPRLEGGPWYLTAAQNTRIVGEYTAKFIDYMVSRGMHLPSLHLTGLSLGAQMAGVCGQNVKSGRIRRITGMDPAGPLFTKWPKSLKLDASDAEFVDVIHTDAGIFGYPTQIGHADFWPNGGLAPQPGCQLKQIKRRNPDAVLELAFCSHWKSYQYFAESVVNPNAFWNSVNCNNWEDYKNGACHEENSPVTQMGLYVDERQNPEHSQRIILNDVESLVRSNIDFSLDTIIFFHGWLESHENDDAQSIKNGYLERGDFNVILVQNERLLAGPDYITAALNCNPIARYSARFIDFMVSKGLLLKKLHVIGLSLGGQIAGMTGQYVKSGRLPRITALDPAGPLFNFNPINERIDPTDADFVDVIFTSSGLWGMKYGVGDANFWPNGGGKKQPGCSIPEVIDRYGLSIPWLLFCSHFRSYQLYTETIRYPRIFPSQKCNSYTTYKLGYCRKKPATAYMGIAARPGRTIPCYETQNRHPGQDYT